MNRTLLIDADIIAYRAAAANEKVIDWGEGVVTRDADFEASKRHAADTIDALVEQLKATDVVVCLSDDFTNFRNSIYPPYKTNRASSERPTHLYDMKEWLAATYPTKTIPTLEADDVMGILATEPHEGQRIIVSADKDMQTIPGWLFNPNKDTKVRRITPEEAQRFMLWQALTGDQTDGYPGCPGCGPKAADQLLAGYEWLYADKEVSRGPRKGQVDRTWFMTQEPDWTPWIAVVSAYLKAGLTEEDAIVQVNLARILKHSDFDGTRPIPWVPAMLN